MGYYRTKFKSVHIQHEDWFIEHYLSIKFRVFTPFFNPSKIYLATNIDYLTRAIS